MMFNIDKCKVMHVGKCNSMLRGRALEKVNEERDLGMIMSSY